jgi:dihydrofolate reductase
MSSLLRVEGHAIVSADGMIADAAGHMPPAIIHEADQRFFSQALDEVDLVIHGRNSREPFARSAHRQRLIVTRRVATLAPHPENPRALLWNPEGATFEAACDAVGITEGIASVIGGTNVYALFLPRFDAFHLSRAEHARIPGGRPVFPGIPPLTPEELLQRHGLRPGPLRVLDAEAGISVRSWRR